MNSLVDKSDMIAFFWSHNTSELIEKLFLNECSNKLPRHVPVFGSKDSFDFVAYALQESVSGFHGKPQMVRCAPIDQFQLTTESVFRDAWHPSVLINFFSYLLANWLAYPNCRIPLAKCNRPWRSRLVQGIVLDQCWRPLFVRQLLRVREKSTNILPEILFRKFL